MSGSDISLGHCRIVVPHGFTGSNGSQVHVSLVPEKDRRFCNASSQAISATIEANVFQSLPYESNDFESQVTYSDADVYIQYRAASQEDTAEAAKWRIKLTPSKQRGLGRLERCGGDLLRIYDKLLEFPGLRPDFTLDDRHIPFRSCHEEVVRYCSAMLDMWTAVVGRVTHACLDRQTVSKVEGLCPLLSCEDAAKISYMMGTESRKVRIFENVQNFASRDEIMIELLKQPRILSFRTFRRDCHVLEVGIPSLNALLPKELSGRESLRQAFKEVYEGQDEMFETKYLDLWLQALRDCIPLRGPHVLRQSRTHMDVSINNSIEDRECRQQALAYEALKLRFNTEEICRRKGDFAPSFQQRPLRLSHFQTAPLRDLGFESRCNRPQVHDFWRDRRFYFQELIYSPEKTPSGQFISSLVIFYEIVKSFWGRSRPLGHNLVIRDVGSQSQSLTDKRDLFSARPDTDRYEEIQRTIQALRRHSSRSNDTNVDDSGQSSSQYSRSVTDGVDVFTKEQAASETQNDTTNFLSPARETPMEFMATRTPVIEPSTRRITHGRVSAILHQKSKCQKRPTSMNNLKKRTMILRRQKSSSSNRHYQIHESLT